MPQAKTNQTRTNVRLNEASEDRPVGSITHTELVSRNPAQTRAFLEGVFDWRFEEMPMENGAYYAGTTPRGRETGIRSARPGELKVVTSYIRVTDLASASALVEEHGGEILEGPIEVPGRGSYFLFEAPGGPILGAWQDSDE